MQFHLRSYYESEKAPIVSSAGTLVRGECHDNFTVQYVLLGSMNEQNKLNTEINDLIDILIRVGIVARAIKLDYIQNENIEKRR